MSILNSKAAMVAAGVAVGAIALYLIGRKLAEQGGETAAAIGTAINPVNPDNVFYSGVNAVGGAVTGDSDFSLGSRIYDWVDGIAGWFGRSDADVQRRMEEEARARIRQDERWLAMDQAEGIG